MRRIVLFSNAGVSYVRDQTENTFHIKGLQGFISEQLAWLYVSLPLKNGQLCFGFLENKQWDQLENTQTGTHPVGKYTH